MSLSDIPRFIATHGLAAVAGVALWHAADAWPMRSHAGPQDSHASAGEQESAVTLRARELADEAAAAYDREAAGSPQWTPKSARDLAEQALAHRAEDLEAWQAEVDALKAAAARFLDDKELLGKIEEYLLNGGDDREAAAMVLAMILQDESRALQELSRRAELMRSISTDVLDALPLASLQRWVAEDDLPWSFRYEVLEGLGTRIGREDRLAEVQRVWESLDNQDLREHFVDEFLREWVVSDGSGAVRRIFGEWPENLRLHFLGQLSGRNEALPIWTDALSEAMRGAPWEAVPEEYKEQVLAQIERARETPDPFQDGPPENLSEPIPAGLDQGEARSQLGSRVERLLGDGPDLRDQLADGRIDVEGLARRLAGRLPGAERYPEEFAGVVFEKTAAIDPAGALRYAEGEVDPASLKGLSSEVLRVMEIYEPRLDRIFEVAALLPVPEDHYRGSDLIAGFIKWSALAPEQARDSLARLPAGHPLRAEIEMQLAKEVAR